MEMSPGKEEIKRLSDFLNEMHIAHYIYGFSLHIPGEATYVSLDDPMEIRVQQNNGMTLRVLKTVEKEGNDVQIEAWKGLDGVIFDVKDQSISVEYRNGELIISLEKT
jgi:hypothetical protein